MPFGFAAPTAMHVRSGGSVRCVQVRSHSNVLGGGGKRFSSHNSRVRVRPSKFFLGGSVRFGLVTFTFKPGGSLGPSRDEKVDIEFVQPDETFEGLDEEEDATVPGNNDPDSKVVKQAVAELASLQAEERNTLGKAYDILARIGVRRPEGLEDTQDLEGVLDDDDDDNDDDDDDKSENDF